jgi:hypothetical protein
MFRRHVRSYRTRCGRFILRGRRHRWATTDPAEHWRPRFAKADALALLEEVLDQVTQNPGWVTQPAGSASSPVAALLDASLPAARIADRESWGP